MQSFVLELKPLRFPLPAQRALLNLNDVIEQLVLLVERELLNNRVSLRLELAPALPVVLGDRVQSREPATTGDDE